MKLKSVSHKPEILYEQEVLSFLQEFVYEPDPNGQHTPPQSIEDVYQDVFQAWGEVERFLRPEEVRKFLLRKYLADGNEEQVLDLVETMERRRYNDRDPLTDYMRKSELGISTGLAHLYARLTDKPVGVIELDFMNMGGTNLFFEKLIAGSKGVPGGRLKDPREAEDMTDLAAKIVAQIVLAELRKSCSDDAVIMPVRAGGDELRVTFTGVDPSEYKALKNRIQHRIEMTMARLGLHDHPHLKAPEDETRRGFGAALSIMDMRKVRAATYTEQADAKIDVEKKIVGHIRAGKVPPPPLILKMAFGPGQKQQNGETLEETIRRDVAERHAAYRAAGEKHKTLETPERGAKEVLSNIRRQMDLAIWELGSHKKQHNVFKDIWDEPAYGENYPFYATPEEENEQRLMRLMADLKIDVDQYEVGFIVNALRGLTPLDPATGVHMARDLPRTLDTFLTDVQKHRNTLCDKYAKEPNKGPIHEAMRHAEMEYIQLEHLGPLVMGVAFHNLAGLNKVFGHDNANKALKFMAQDIVKKTAVAHHFKEDDYVMVHYGGGEFALLFKPVIELGQGFVKFPSAKDMKAMSDSITAQIQGLNHMELDDFIDKLGMEIEDPAELARLKLSRVGDIPDAKGRDWVDGLHVSSTVYNLTGAPWKRGVTRAGQYLQNMRDLLEGEVTDYRNARKQAYEARQTSMDFGRAASPARTVTHERGAPAKPANEQGPPVPDKKPAKPRRPK